MNNGANQTDTATMLANIPNQSLEYGTYTPTFGNLQFQIQPSMTGEVSNSFGTVPYLSLESLVYLQQIQSQTSPVTVLPGQNQGQQNIQGQYTVTDLTGQTRVIMGSGKF